MQVRHLQVDILRIGLCSNVASCQILLKGLMWKAVEIIVLLIFSHVLQQAGAKAPDI
jgi:hypothetical protein